MGATARLVPLGELDSATLHSWAQLGLRGGGARPDPFSMPQFVIPAARWLTPSRPPCVLLVEQSEPAGHALIGVGCFSIEPPNWFVPMPHLCTYATRHSFRGGILHRDGQATAVAEALLDFLDRHGSRHPRRAMVFHNVRADCQVLRAMQSSTLVRARWFDRKRSMRPVLRMRADSAPVSQLKASARKNLARCRRRLEERGRVEVRVWRGVAADARVAETHLALEHLGWKGAAGTSMLGNAAEAGFFRELVDRQQVLGDGGGMVFTELLLEGRPVASTSNLLLGDSLSAFKTGWDPELARFSPGVLNELELCRRIPELMPQVEMFDSLAKPDSYLAGLLPDREEVCTGVLAVGRIAEATMHLARVARPAAYWRQRRASPD